MAERDVVVVGGGPAGAATAAHLAARGRDVLLLEQARFPREKPCAEYLSPGAVDLLARLGALDAVRAGDVAWPAGMRICSPGGELLLIYPAAHGPHRPALGVQRAAFDAALLDRARGAGADVRERARVTAAVVADGRVIGVRVLGAGGGGDVVRARVVVGADGAHSAVARSLGLTLSVRWPRRLGLVARYRGVRSIGRYGEMHVGRGVYCGLAPVGEGIVSVGLVGGLADRRPGESKQAYFERRVAELPGVARALGGAHRVTPIRGVGPIARRVRRVAGPGYLLVGDAAGFFDPFTGEGVFRALRGAELAADTIDRALQTGDDADLAAEYARARRGAFAEKEAVTAIVQLFLSRPAAFEYALRRLAARPRLARTLSAVLGDYRPASAALNPLFLLALLRP